MDERETFISALRESFGANDNSDAHDGTQQKQTSVNIAGHVFNIDKIELSVVLPDSKKKLTNRAFVLSYLLSILSTDTHSKKTSSYPHKRRSVATDTLKKNVEKFTFLLFNSHGKTAQNQSIPACFQ